MGGSGAAFVNFVRNDSLTWSCTSLRLLVTYAGALHRWQEIGGASCRGRVLGSVSFPVAVGSLIEKGGVRDKGGLGIVKSLMFDNTREFWLQIGPYWLKIDISGSTQGKITM